MTSARELRRRLLGRHVDFRRTRGLEIGALDGPVVTKDEADVSYLDFLTHEELVARHRDRRATERIVPPDFVSRDGRISAAVGDRFDWIVACHVLEHVDDTIGWLADVAETLAPGGHLLLALPDRRFTFDYLRPTTSLGHLLADHLEGPRRADLEHVFDHFYYKRDVRTAAAWSGRHDEAVAAAGVPAAQALALARNHAASARPADVHRHVFTSESFADLMAGLRELDLCHFETVDQREVVRNHNEFLVLLRSNRASR